MTSRGGYQRFEGGQLWRLGTSAPVRVTGPMLDAWVAKGGHVGSYKYPLTDTVKGSGGRWTCTFESGTIVV